MVRYDGDASESELKCTDAVVKALETCFNGSATYAKKYLPDIIPTISGIAQGPNDDTVLADYELKNGVMARVVCFYGWGCYTVYKY
jgi:hypothetical protein